MASYNKVILIGNLTRDVEVRFTPKGTAVAEISLAVNNSYTDKATGQKREDCTFVDVTLWGATAENAAKFLGKGKPVMIEGRLSLDTWDDKQSGQKRSKLKVVCETMQFLGSRDGGDRQKPEPDHGKEFDRPAPVAAGGSDGFPDDDVPF